MMPGVFARCCARREEFKARGKKPSADADIEARNEEAKLLEVFG